MMRIMTEDSARELTDPYFGKMKGCFERAFEKYRDFLVKFPGSYYKRTSSILLHNWIVNEIKAQFGNYAHILIKEKYESIQLVFSQILVARFKKLSAEGFPNNHKSTRNDTILAQGQLELNLGAVFEAPTNINIGYIPDAIGRHFAELKITCIHNKEMVWDIGFTKIESEDFTPAIYIEQPEAPIETAKPRFIINGEKTNAVNDQK